MKVSLSKIVVERLSQVISLKLRESKAIKINFESPFQLVSGKTSPIYINCRVMISDPDFLDLFNIIAKILLRDLQFHFYCLYEDVAEFWFSESFSYHEGLL